MIMKGCWNIVVLMLVLVVSSCDKPDDLAFDPMINFPDGDVVLLDMDLQGVVNQGIVLPSNNQSPDNGFVFSFKGKKGQYYKIYYQNESYKFDENSDWGTENFYGSWEDVSVGFKKVGKDGIVYDTLRIVGNPRNELKYYGADVSKKLYTPETLSSCIEKIKSNPKYYQTIVEKAERNGFSVKKQLTLDAMWVINANKNKGNYNHRWKRNPRVGVYSFMLVVCDLRPGKVHRVRLP